jgi:peptidoglycan/LPS O-acetylase OafA/YrhL
MAVFCIVARGALGIDMHLHEHISHEAAEQIAKIAYRATPTHMDGLLFGALIAIMSWDKEGWLARTWKRLRSGVLVVTSLMILALFFKTEGFKTYDGRVIVFGYGALALFFATIVSIAVDGGLHPVFSAIFTSRPLRACGRVSYAMYLFHWPMVVFTIPFCERWIAAHSSTEGIAFGVGVLLVGTLVTYVLAEVSFRFVESPFLRLKERFHE